MNNVSAVGHDRTKQKRKFVDSEMNKDISNNFTDSKNNITESSGRSHSSVPASSKTHARKVTIVTDDVKPAALPHDYEVSKFDVVCGRGKSSYERPGNRRFLDIVNDHIVPYRSATQKKQKAAVLCKIVIEVRRGNGKEIGRWVKQVEDGSWWEIGDPVAREKAGQAMRVAVRMRAEQGDLVNRHDFYGSNKRMRLFNDYGVARAAMTNQCLAATSAAAAVRLTSEQPNHIVAGGMRVFDGYRSVGSNELSQTQTRRNINAGTAVENLDQVVTSATKPECPSLLFNPTQIMSSRSGSELPAVGRLWLVVKSSWKPGNSDDSGIVWVGRTVKCVFPNEQVSTAGTLVANTTTNSPIITVADAQQLTNHFY